MYKLYKITNKISGTVYFGMTKNKLRNRWNSHKYVALVKKKKTKFADAIRSYGLRSFKMELIEEYLTKEDCCESEKFVIACYKGKTYNLAVGGETGFDMRLKPKEEYDAWRYKLSQARREKQPFQGKRHTKETKEICRISGSKRWDIHGRYPLEVLNYPFIKANKIYGISKTHYYRLRRTSNDCT